MAGESADGRKRWLGSYMELQSEFEPLLMRLLRKLYSALLPEVKKMDASEMTVSEYVASAQGKAFIRVFEQALKDLRVGEEGLIERFRSGATARAVIAGLEEDRSLLHVVGLSEEKRDELQKALILAASRNIDAMIIRNLGTKYELSDRVWGTSKLVRKQLDTRINEAIARGKSAKYLAGQVKDLVSPATPGGVQYAAKRLARTEINNAFHAQSIQDMKDKPWIFAAEWNLSKSHPDTGCTCEYYAELKRFNVDDIPPKPHPNCFCYIVPLTPADDEIPDLLQDGEINDWIDKVLAK